MTPIAQAVEPLRTDAVAAAQTAAKARIARMTAALDAAGMNLDVVAPRPDSLRTNRETYRRMMAVRDAFAAITRSTQAVRRPGEPCIVRVDQELCERMVRMSGEAADAEYTAFIAKLETKVGEHTAATLTGNHVWGYSLLTVETPAGTQTWKTRQIGNVSKLGLHFPQWPSRKVKGG